MKPTPIIDMFSGTGELARAVGDGLNEFTGFQSFSDNYGPARRYLREHFSLGAPSQDLSVAGNAVVRLQARLMLQRGLTTINNERSF